MYALNLFKSSFELAQLHREKSTYQELWGSDAVQSALHREQAGRPLFLLHDGPPYANGNLHLGHFVNKSLKDALMKFKRLDGYFAPYVPGFDCHGLPVELEVEKLGFDKKDPVKFVAACRDYAANQVELQTQEFKSFGVTADWDHKYRTLDPEFESSAARFFMSLPQTVKRLRPVHWCPKCASSLAEAEVEYKLKASESVVVLFEDSQRPNRFLQVWTTTPYTLPANKGVAFNPAMDYVEFPDGDRMLVRARQDADPTDLAPVPLGGMTVVSPYTKALVPVLPADYVSNAGTGLVHLAPSFGMDDFRVGEAFGLAVESFMDATGRYLEGELKGMPMADATEAVLTALGDLLYSRIKVEHEYPHCWRHKSPLFFKASEEWFLDLAQVGEDALKALDAVEFVPASGRERLTSMLQGRTSWCLSRTRLWGSPLADPASPEDMAQLKLVEAQGLSAWHEGHARRTLDVWFDSGVTHELVLKKRFGRTADVYLEGSDQHRGWFQSSLLTAVAAGGPAPFKTLLTHGFVVDELGRKYSKSSKNYQPLQKLFEQHSPDVLRLWALSQDYTKDLKLSKESLARTTERYRKLRNTVRFCLQNTQDFDFKQTVELTHTLHLQQVKSLHDLVASVQLSATRFDFAAAVTALMSFCEATSGDYFTAFKDVLYCDAPASPRRLQAQYALALTLQVVMRLLVPLLPYTAEELFKALKEPMGFTEESAVLLTFGTLTLPVVTEAGLPSFEHFKTLKHEVHQWVESQRGVVSEGVALLKSPAQLALALSAPVELPLDDLKDYFGCAELTLTLAPDYRVAVTRTTLALCPRCRAHRVTHFSGLCHRCEDAEDKA